MLLSSAEISALVGTYLWPLIRIAALVTAMPVFSSNFVPMRVRLAIAIALTIAIAPVIPAPPAIDAISLAGLELAIHQVLIGIAMGFIFHLVISSFIIAGQIIAMQTGLGFALMVDPVNGSQAPVLSMFYMLLVTLFFMLLDGHLALIGLLSQSFHSLPISASGLSVDSYWELAMFGAEMFKQSLLVSLPAVTALLLVNVALGVMGRAAPQLNIFAVGFSITITVGFYVMLVSLPVVYSQFQNISVNAFDVVKSMVLLN